MPYEIKLEFPNADVVSAEVKELVTLDFTPMWPLVADRIREITADLFASQGATGAHGEWKPNEKRYRERKEKQWAITEVERASGRLFYSLTGETMDSIAEYGPSDMVIGTRTPYALWQQTGTKKMAARRLFDLTQKDVGRIGSLVARWIQNKERRAGYGKFGSRFFENGGDARQAGMQIISPGRPLSEGF